jgi:hypothetical protein
MKHDEFIIKEIHKELDLLFSTFDTKVLSAAMMLRSAHALRAVHSAGLWHIEDVKAVVDDSLKDIYVRLPEAKIPRVCVMGGKNTLQ